MGYSYERYRTDETYYFRVHYAAQPFCRVRDTGHEWEILFAPGRGPKHAGPYYAESLAQVKQWIDGYARHHQHRLASQMMRIISGKEPNELWPWEDPADAVNYGQTSARRI